MSTKIPRAENEEAVGVRSGEVQRMIDDMAKNNVDIHSLMILRGGKVACEAYKSPIIAEDTHMMYSVSKSFLSVAYDFAFDEGIIDYSTKFLDIFPELRPKKRDEKLEKLTLIQLLEMAAGKRTSRTKDNWLKSFVNAKWDFAPGEDWRYVSDNYYTASAALVKAVGMSVTDYLTPRLYEPLGIEPPFWETSPQNIEVGGWGLFLKTENVAKFILCCHNDGVYNGRQIIPRAWIKKATSKIYEISSSQTETDSTAGYGYGFWQCAGMSDTFRCEGMYSQYAISFGAYDACLVITAGCAELQKTLCIIWNHTHKIFTDTKDNEEKITVKIPSTEPFSAEKRSPLEKKIDGAIYKLGKRRFINACGYPASSIPMLAIFFAKDKGGSITDLSFEFEKDCCVMKWTENGNFVNTQKIAMDETFAHGKITIGELCFKTAACGRWLDERTFEVCIYPIAAVAKKKVCF